MQGYPKFLYLEDNKLNQLIMKNILHKHSLTLKDNAHDVLDYVERYDILLLDFHLNHTNGNDVIELLQQKKINIPIIMVTSESSPEKLEYFKEKGVMYFNKPVNVTNFKKYLEKNYNVNF